MTWYEQGAWKDMKEMRGRIGNRNMGRQCTVWHIVPASTWNFKQVFSVIYHGSWNE